jgi:hypothetical protein
MAQHTVCVTLTQYPVEHGLCSHQVLRPCIAVQLVLQGVLDLLLQVLWEVTAAAAADRG